MHPILLYDSDVWCVNVSIDITIDKLFYHYMRCVLNVKPTTSNVIVVGECGQMPPSIYCHIDLKRLQDLPDTKIVKQVFNELNRLHRYGVRTWVTKACQLADKYGIDIDSSNKNYKKHCKLVISDWYKRNWSREVTDIHKHPILRTYSMIKQDFGLKKYLKAISDWRYRIATSKLRASSHALEIERGRYTKPKTDISKRLCPVCYTIEDEVHFLINCKLYEPEWQLLFLMINEKKQNLQSLNDIEKLTFLLSNWDNQLIVWIGKFIYKCFQARSDFVLE